ncbi:alpha/beta hydrolase [Streptomyces huiliensis]|uniref:alpha/beta hydrolase n=1 Tax=Streptomyces huiliensis TaxID=2876027 RepID=UPI001CBFE370|nr:alpha/beta hydrolase [Streptomyces huiliensis]MBZ4321197.1 alpha/beta hydrolase [Streptomyces huiliensis]
MTPLRRVAAAVLTAAACLTALPAAAEADPGGTGPGPGPGAGAGTGTSAGLARYHHQRPDWRSCVQGPDDDTGRTLEKAGARCATISVPLDYSDPGGRTLTLALSRIKATDTAHRAGALLVNSGGPGGPSLDLAVGVREAMKGVGARYDVIGMDPRFVGRSSPLDCHWPTGTWIRSAGTGRQAFDRQAAFQRGLAESCGRTAGDVLPHVTTRNTARDMDVVREVLGERRISYLGYSYGTYLGTVYTQMFPGRTDRVVLDGAIGPRDYGPRMLSTMLDANERALEHWADWAARRDARYGFGRTRERVLAAVHDIVRTAARRPLVLDTGKRTYEVDDTVVPSLLFGDLADDRDPARAALADSVTALRRAARGETVEPPEPLAEALAAALTGADSASASAQAAILCGDAAAPRDPETYRDAVEKSRAAHPLFGPLFHNTNPCAFWPSTPREEPTQVRTDARALIVAATGDPRTTYAASRHLHGLLPSSRLLTLQGADHHGQFGEYGNACVDGRVNAYLATGRLPATDTTCPK